MATLTQDRATPLRASEDFGFPVAASTKLYAGSIACINSSGYLTKGAVATTLKCVGVMQAAADNSAGAAAAITGKVKRGCFKFLNSASTDLIALADVGADCYIVDDQTVAKTNGSNARSVAGKIRDVESDGVWVEI
ncbi:MAG: hypothetical protein WAV95_15860 [Azonexus sp.]